MARYLGTSGNDSLAGAANEPDAFFGFGIGSDRVIGGNFDDTFVMAVDEATDKLDGGNGEDTLDYSKSDRALNIDLTHGTVTAQFGGTPFDPLHTSLVAEIAHFEDVVGSRFSDRITGDGGNNVIEGGAGADVINGSGGNDTASYAHSAAAVDVELGHFVQHGGDAEGDQLISIENVTGSAFNDHLSGSSANNVLDGGAGFDTADYSEVTGGIKVAFAEGLVLGDASVGTDTLRGIEAVEGTNFADKFDATGFSGSSANAGDQGAFNQFEGMGGNDLIIGNGDTRISYLHAASGVMVDIAAHTAVGDSSVGVDTFTGVNNVLGSNFADSLFGSDNAAGTTEKFDGHAGNDLIDGRGGFDLAIYSNDPSTQSGINVDLANGIVQGDASIGTDNLLSVEAIRGTNFNDVYDAFGFGSGSANAGSLGTLNQFEGMGGDDTIIGNGNTHLVFFNATAGVTVNMVAGTVSGDASVGHDSFSGVSAVSGSDFADTIVGSHHNDFLTGGGGGDIFEMTAAFGHDTITDFAAGEGSGHDVIHFDANSGPTDFAGVMSLAHQVGSDAVIGVDPLNSVTLSNLSLSALTAHDFTFG